jgi:hypothetical protein
MNKMKLLKVFILLIAVGSLITFSNCGGGGSTPEPLADQQFTKLAGSGTKTWKISSVTLDGAANSQYNGFTLTISGTKGATIFNYSVANRPALSPWKASGKWSFGTNISTDIIRDPDIATDKQEMTYTVTDNTLEIKFNFQGAGYTRTDQVGGNWIFTFSL